MKFEAYIYRKHKYEYTNIKISIVIPIENIMRIKCIAHNYLPFMNMLKKFPIRAYKAWSPIHPPFGVGRVLKNKFENNFSIIENSTK